MTEEQKQKFRELFPEYTVKDREVCLSPYIDIFEAGIEIATKEQTEENYTIKQNCGENRVEGGVVGISGSVSEKHTCKECVGETVFKGKKAYCKNRNCDLPACDNFMPKKYRPFKNCEELLKTYDKIFERHTGIKPIECKLNIQYIWVKEKGYGISQLITGFGDTVVKFSPDYTITLKSLFENYEFLDSSPCGCLEK